MKRTLFENLDALMILACVAVCIAVWLTCSGCVAKGAVEAPMTVFNKESARVFADAIGERFDKTAEAIGEAVTKGVTEFAERLIPKSVDGGTSTELVGTIVLGALYALNQVRKWRVRRSKV